MFFKKINLNLFEVISTFTTLKKQVFILFLAIGVIAPVSAMDLQQESPGWFGWKSVAGITVLVSAGALWAYHAWTKPVPKRPVSKNAGTKKVTKAQHEEQVVATLLAPMGKSETAEDRAYAEQLENATPEFFASEKRRLDTLIAQLEREIAQEQRKK